MSPNQIEKLTGWVNDLCTLTMGGKDVSPDTIQTYVRALMAEFPPQAFTQECLQHVYRQCNTLPPYAKLRQFIREHFENGPAMRAALSQYDAALIEWAKNDYSGPRPAIPEIAKPSRMIAHG
ncbi:hypothetical protein [Acetobacter senegalensis]|uniref:hypothetical protein n=1 Tax=Acetobacter senegalensis TaxID=446692 RepID=UPI001EDB95FF|nr:hypothetical protein [Acetobacter senegalensis]MCG4256906.1 hypothetical protein [Acetobacter senegalensis]MCG4266956.1 hypothetical protein [Acetobacter senegalensis]